MFFVYNDIKENDYKFCFICVFMILVNVLCVKELLVLDGVLNFLYFLMFYWEFIGKYLMYYLVEREDLF